MDPSNMFDDLLILGQIRAWSTVGAQVKFEVGVQVKFEVGAQVKFEANLNAP